MNIFKDFYKAFKLHRIIFEFSVAELEKAVFTDEEKKTLNDKANDYETRLIRAQILARGIERGNNKKRNL